MKKNEIAGVINIPDFLAELDEKGQPPLKQENVYYLEHLKTLHNIGSISKYQSGQNCISRLNDLLVFAQAGEGGWHLYPMPDQQDKEKNYMVLLKFEIDVKLNTNLFNCIKQGFVVNQFIVL